MNSWIDEIRRVAAHGEDGVIVTVAAVRGSAPREAGAKMIVTAQHSYSTIGGGELEYQCTKLACMQLGEAHAGESRLRKFTLGANCGQCCGGVVEVLFETVSAAGAAWLERLADLHAARVAAAIVTEVNGAGKHVVTAQDCAAYGGASGVEQSVVTVAHEALLDGSGARVIEVKSDAGHKRRYMIEPVTCSDFNIAVFGAGHVGTATVAALARLDCNIRWIDSRRNFMVPLASQNVISIEAAQPSLEVQALPANSYYLVMTHSHALDFEICGSVLRRQDFAYCGLIGSRSKKRRFERLMRQQQLPEALICRLTCPIGVRGIEGKRPEEIAVAVSAQLLQLRFAQRQARSGGRSGVRLLRASRN